MQVTNKKCKFGAQKPTNKLKQHVSLLYTDQPETRLNDTTVLIQHSKWCSFSLSTCSLPNKEIPNMDIHYSIIKGSQGLL